MKAVQIVFKVLLILALIAMCLVIIFVTPKAVVPDLNSGIQVIPEKDSTLVNANNSLLISPDSIPETDSDDAINLAYKMYLIANENMKKTLTNKFGRGGVLLTNRQKGGCCLRAFSMRKEGREDLR